MPAFPRPSAHAALLAIGGTLTLVSYYTSGQRFRKPLAFFCLTCTVAGYFTALKLFPVSMNIQRFVQAVRSGKAPYLVGIRNFPAGSAVEDCPGVTVFYPCSNNVTDTSSGTDVKGAAQTFSSGRAKTKISPVSPGYSWLPRGDHRYSDGMARYANIPSFLLNHLTRINMDVQLNHPIHPDVLAAYSHYPSTERKETDEKGAPDISKFPIIIFSHGLAGHSQMYSAFAIDLASQGAIVISMEHMDGSACFSRRKTFSSPSSPDVPAPNPDTLSGTQAAVIREEGGEETLVELVHPLPSHVDGYHFRRRQLQKRVLELDIVLREFVLSKSSFFSRLLGRSAEPTGCASARTTLWNPPVCLMGHSFGAATALVAAFPMRTLSAEEFNKLSDSTAPLPRDVSTNSMDGSRHHRRESSLNDSYQRSDRCTPVQLFSDPDNAIQHCVEHLNDAFSCVVCFDLWHEPLYPWVLDYLSSATGFTREGQGEENGSTRADFIPHFPPLMLLDSLHWEKWKDSAQFQKELQKLWPEVQRMVKPHTVHMTLADVSLFSPSRTSWLKSLFPSKLQLSHERKCIWEWAKQAFEYSQLSSSKVEESNRVTRLRFQDE